MWIIIPFLCLLLKFYRIQQYSRNMKTGAQLGHSWGKSSWGTISGQTREKLVWPQLQLVHSWGPFGAFISLGISWGRVEDKMIVKVRNSQLHLLLIKILCALAPNCAPTVSKEDVCPECASIMPQLCPELNSLHFAPTVPQSALPQLCPNSAPNNFCPKCAPAVPKSFQCFAPTATVPQLCLARLPNCPIVKIPRDKQETLFYLF